MVSSPQINTAPLKRELTKWERSLLRFADHPYRPRAIHDFRTASRRCLEATRLLGHALPALEHLIRQLGPIRDLEAVLEKRTEPGQRARLTARLHAHQSTLQHTLRSASIKRIRIDLKRLRSLSIPPIPIDEIRKLQQKIQRFDSIPLQAPPVKLHNLRRALRRVRLVSELLKGGKAMQQLSREAAMWQRALGEWRDMILLHRKDEEAHFRKVLIRLWNKTGSEKVGGLINRVLAL